VPHERRLVRKAAAERPCAAGTFGTRLTPALETGTPSATRRHTAGVTIDPSATRHNTAGVDRSFCDTSRHQTAGVTIAPAPSRSPTFATSSRAARKYAGGKLRALGRGSGRENNFVYIVNVKLDNVSHNCRTAKRFNLERLIRERCINSILILMCVHRALFRPITHRRVGVWMSRPSLLSRRSTSTRSTKFA
jgi:hypothetical protein